jgi:hypothetical protein
MYKADLQSRQYRQLDVKGLILLQYKPGVQPMGGISYVCHSSASQHLLAQGLPAWSQTLEIYLIVRQNHQKELEMYPNFKSVRII